MSLPDGTVTFLFTDIERSTELVVDVGTDYPKLLALYRDLTEQTARSQRGSIFGSEGDGLYFAFAEAGAAVAAAVEMQSAYRRAAWPGGVEVRVRIGIHTGTPTLIGDDYTGIDVHRAARVADAAWGGQIIMSDTTRALVSGSGALWRDLGWFAMKGLSRPERLYQLERGESAEDFPPPRARHRGISLPAQLTTMIGRSEEVAAVVSLFAEGARLVTLTGPGGIGKTRIALAAAEHLDPTYAEGVALVELSEESDPAGVLTAIGSRMGAGAERGRTPLEVVGDHLAPAEVLLVLDGCERVAAAAPDLAALLARCTGLRLLVTSRSALRLAAEREYRVAPLATADPQGTVESIAAVPAVRLFVDRVQAVRPGFTLTADNAAIVAAIVATLDGIPLSIELAAARARLLPPEAILQRLGGVLDLATSATDLPARQRSVRSTIEWSHGLLGEAEQALLRRLGVFVGGWTLEAAEAVCGGEDVGDVLSGLEALVSQSMIIADPDGRMEMGTAVREFAGERLAASGEEEAIRLRHAEHFAAVATESEPPMRGVRQRELLAALSRDWGNFMAAAAWAMGANRLDLAAAVYTGTWIIAWHGDHWREVQSYSERFATIADAVDGRLRARVLFVAAGIALETGDFERALTFARPAAELSADVGDGGNEAWARLMIAGGLMFQDVFSAEGRQQIARAIDLAGAADDPLTQGYALSFEGTAAALDGDAARGLAAHGESLRLARSIDNAPLITQALSQSAITHLVAGDRAAARRCLEEGIQYLDRLRGLEWIANYLDSVALLAFAEEDRVRAMTALGAGNATRERVGLARWAILESLLQGAGAAAEGEQPELATARAAGSEMDPRDAIALALSPHHELAAAG